MFKTKIINQNKDNKVRPSIRMAGLYIKLVIQDLLPPERIGEKTYRKKFSNKIVNKN